MSILKDKLNRESGRKFYGYKNKVLPYAEKMSELQTNKNHSKTKARSTNMAVVENIKCKKHLQVLC